MSTPAPSQLRTMAPRLPGSVTPSTATRKGGRPLRLRRRKGVMSASAIGAALASTPCGASLRASASSRLRATYATATRLAAASASMSSTASVPCRSALIHTSCTRRRWASSNSRTAWRPSTCSPPRPLSTLRGGASPARRTGPVRPAPRLAGFVDPRRPAAARPPRPCPGARRAAVTGSHSTAASERAPASEWPATACVAGERHDLSSALTVFRDHGHRPGGDALLTSDRAEPLCAPAGNADRCAHGTGEVAFHLVLPGGQLRSLAHDLDVDVADRPPRFPHHVGSRGEDHERVGTGPAGVGVGEVAAEVTQPCGAEQRVGGSVGGHVGIAVTIQPALVFEAAAAEHQRAGRVVAVAVHVEALSDTDHARRPTAFPFMSRSVPRTRY